MVTDTNTVVNDVKNMLKERETMKKIINITLQLTV